MFSGRRQPSCDDTSRMNREVQVRICEGLRVEFPGPTRHFQTKSEALSARVYWSGPPTRADVLALGKQGRRVRLVYLFTPPHRRSVRAITLSTSPNSKLPAANDEPGQAKPNSLADKVTGYGKIFADLLIE